MPFDFPNNPTIGQIVQFPSGTQQYVWTGVSWDGAPLSAQFITGSGGTSVTASYALTASVLLGSVESASFALTASYFITSSVTSASYAPIIAGPGIKVNGMEVSASVLTVNGSYPDASGNITTALTAVLTGPSASLFDSSSGDVTGSFTEGTVWVVANDPSSSLNGDSYIFAINDSGSGEWLKLSSLDQVAADQRYLMLTPQAPLSGSLVAPFGVTGSLFGTASHVKVTGSGVVVNWVGDLLQLTASAGAPPSLRINPVKITDQYYNGFLILGDNGRLYTVNAQQGDEVWTNAYAADQRSSGIVGFKEARQIMFPAQETGSIVDMGVYGRSAYALFANGNLYTWGYNSEGQLGVGDFNARYIPALAQTAVVQVYNTPTTLQTSYGNNRLFIKNSQGRIFGCGYNGFGALGLGNTTNRNIFTEITAAAGATSFWNMGGLYGCIFFQLPDGTIWTAGYNGHGQLGTGDQLNKTTPVNVTANWTGGEAGAIIQKVLGGYGYFAGSASTISWTGIWLRRSNGLDIVRMAGNNSFGTIGGRTIGNTNFTTPVVSYNAATQGYIKKILQIGDGPGSLHVLNTTQIYYNWGWNGQGQLGRGNTTNSSAVQVVGESLYDDMWAVEGAATVSGYIVPGVVLRKSVPGMANEYYTCGENFVGQLGIGTFANALSLTRILLPAGVDIALFGGYSATQNRTISVIVSQDGRVFACGKNADDFSIIWNRSANIPIYMDVTPDIFRK